MPESSRPCRGGRPRVAARSVVLLTAALGLAVAGCAPGPALDESGLLVPPSLPVEVSLYSERDNPRIAVPRDVLEGIVGCVEAAERVPATPAREALGIPAFAVEADGGTAWVHREAILLTSPDSTEELVEGCEDSFPALLEAAGGQLSAREIAQLEEG